MTVTVANRSTAEWLRKTIWSANAKLGKNLKVVEGDEIPKAKLITMFLPKAEKLSKEDILKAITASNDLDTEQ